MQKIKRFIQRVFNVDTAPKYVQFYPKGSIRK